MTVAETSYIAGTGMTATGRFLDRPLRNLAAEAIANALTDAGLAIEDLDAVFFSNVTQSALQGQHMIAGQTVARSFGIEGIPVINVENACASAATALFLAQSHLTAGRGRIVLAIGAEKMVHAEKAKTMSIFDGAFDIENQKGLEEFIARQSDLGRDAARLLGERSIFMDIYAAWARAHITRYGLTQRQLAAVSSKNHHHSQYNALAQYRDPISIDEVLAAREIVWPLTLPMCAPVSDGAAAVVLVDKEALQKTNPKRAIPIRACELSSGTDRDDDELARHVSRRAALKAYEAAGVSPQDISVAEVHDATAFGEVLQSELMGFFELGQGGWAAEKAETSIGGRIPINSSGGLESKGHPIGATGLMQIYELVSQLRGEAGKRQIENPRMALAENGGGFIGNEEAAACVTILERPKQ